MDRATHTALRKIDDNIMHTKYTGCANKKQSLGKINYLSYCNRFFFTKFIAFTEKVSGYISSKYHYNIYCGLKITTI